MSNHETPSLSSETKQPDITLFVNEQAVPFSSAGAAARPGNWKYEALIPAAVLTDPLVTEIMLRTVDGDQNSFHTGRPERHASRVISETIGGRYGHDVAASLCPPAPLLGRGFQAYLPKWIFNQFRNLHSIGFQRYTRYGIRELPNEDIPTRG